LIFDLVFWNFLVWQLFWPLKKLGNFYNLLVTLETTQV